MTDEIDEIDEYSMRFDDLTEAEKERMTLDVHADAARKAHSDYDAIVNDYIEKIAGNFKITNQIMAADYPAEELYKRAGSHQESLGEMFEDSAY